MTSIEGSNRLQSLDALRGFTIIAMIIVNSPGSWDHVYAPLLHADWNGITPTDLIFPLFIFIVGVSITYALKNAKEKGEIPTKKILSRSLKIFLVGIFLWFWPSFDFSNIRFAGVLQRIALIYLACSIIFLLWNEKKWLMLLTIVLLGYWALLTLVPIPIDAITQQAIATQTIEKAWGEIIPIQPLTQLSESYISPNLEPGTNLVAWVDRKIVPGVFWEKTWDPEGLFSTFPAIASGILGLWTGKILQSKREAFEKVAILYFAGFICFLIGEVWSWVFPINKNLWTSSFVLWTGGLSMMGLSTTYLFVDIWKKSWWTQIGIIFGSNAITSYALSGMLTVIFYNNLLTRESLNSITMEAMINIGISPKMASLMYAIIYVLILLIPAYILFKKKIFIKL
jgi:predicted acyltransferase